MTARKHIETVMIRCAVCGVSCLRPIRTAGGQSPKTCGLKECVKQHKRNLKNALNRKYSSGGRMKEWAHIKRSKDDPLYEYKQAMRQESSILKRELIGMAPSLVITHSVCKLCGISFEGNRMYCSNRCMWRAANARPHRKTLRHRISSVISSRISGILKKHKQGKALCKWETKFSINKLGYTWDQFIKHIESLFLEGMTWNNYGKWHIDHILPIAIHGNDMQSIRQAYALSNLMPRWATTRIAWQYGSKQIGNTNKGKSLILT